MKIRSGVVFGAENENKSGSERGEQDSNCLVFLDFLPDIVKQPIVRYFYEIIQLLPVILRYLDPKSIQSGGICAQ